MQAQRRIAADRQAANDTAPAIVSIVPAAAPRGLDEREIHAIAVGRADAFRFGWAAQQQQPSGLRRVAGWLAALAGVRRVTPFADDRLETLRLFVCMMRRDDRRLDALAMRLLSCGFSPAALHQATQLALA